MIFYVEPFVYNTLYPYKCISYTLGEFSVIYLLNSINIQNLNQPPQKERWSNLCQSVTLKTNNANRILQFIFSNSKVDFDVEAKLSRNQQTQYPSTAQPNNSPQYRIPLHQHLSENHIKSGPTKTCEQTSRCVGAPISVHSGK